MEQWRHAKMWRICITWSSSPLVYSINSRWNASNFNATCSVCSVNGFAVRTYSKLTCYSHVAVMACKMKDGHCVTHMSTTWIVPQTIHERSTNISKTFPGDVIDNTKKILSIYQQMKFTLCERSYCHSIILSKLHTCRTSHLTRILLTYPLPTSCDWQFRFCVT